MTKNRGSLNYSPVSVFPVQVFSAQSGQQGNGPVELMYACLLGEPEESFPLKLDAYLHELGLPWCPGSSNEKQRKRNTVEMSGRLLFIIWVRKMATILVLLFTHKCSLVKFVDLVWVYRERCVRFVCGLRVLDTIFVLTFNDAIFVRCHACTLAQTS